MCGITGVLRLDDEQVPDGLIARMNATIAHRGPDDDGVWVEGFVGLGSRRLAIIDPTPAGHQPMQTEDGGAVLVYNGELYNHQSLRLELENAGHRFHSRSDTEVIVHAYEAWGTACVERFNGMFAFAVWDRRERRLLLARDRFGVKPLYWYDDGRVFAFASEIKAILAVPGVRREVCREALDEYFTFQNVLSDRTLFDGIRLLPPGHVLEIEPGREARLHQYWDYPFARAQTSITIEEAAEELQRRFVQAVTRQLVSDVPVASYLSGGIDSGAIASIAKRHLPELMTFTAGFDLSSASGMELGFDERAEAEFLSNQLKTEQYEMVLHAGDMERVMPDLIWHLEDLRVGQSYPNYCVARLAGKFVKVVLSGAGGDELFGGYPWRYFHGLGGRGADFYRTYYEYWQRLVPDDEKSGLFRPDILRAVDPASTFSVFRNVFSRDMPMETKGDFVNASLYFELKTFLHGLLVVEDKVSMAHSLETRVPFLDNDLVDFACSLPAEYKVDIDAIRPVDENDLAKYRQTGGKRLLRQAMSGILPAAVRERKKQGFSAPDASWFRGESIDYVNRFLRDSRSRMYEYVMPAYVARKLDEHTAGRHNHRLLIWSLLSFEWWLRKFLP